jgi:plastocyanin
MRNARLAIVVVSMMLALVACSGGSSSAPTGQPSTAPSGAPSAAAGDAVSIAGFAFQPGEITVSVGTTVTWTNNDTPGHTVTADDGSFKSDTLATGTTFSQTFASAGTFAYHCSIHSSMTGTVTVK